MTNLIEYHLYLIDYTLTLRNAQDLFREVILVAYWPTRVHDHQTALKQSTHNCWRFVRNVNGMASTI